MRVSDVRELRRHQRSQCTLCVHQNVARCHIVTGGDGGEYRSFRGTGFMEYWIGLSHQSALMLSARTTLLHFSVSAAMNLPKSAGAPASAVPPRSASRAFNLGSASAALISLLSMSMISTGVFFGMPTPYQLLAS